METYSGTTVYCCRKAIFFNLEAIPESISESFNSPIYQTYILTRNKQFPVPFLFMPIGSLMGLTFSLPRQNAYSWSEITSVLTAIVIGLSSYFMIGQFKRILFLHFYALIFGSSLLCIAGFIISFGSIRWSLIRPGDIDEVVFGSVIGGIGSSVVYVAGLAYIHIRTSSSRYYSPHALLFRISLNFHANENHKRKQN